MTDLADPSEAELRRAMPGLRGMIKLEGVGHWVQHEALERLNHALVSFLRGL